MKICKIYQLAINVNHLYQTCLNQFKSKIPASVEHIVLTENPYPEYKYKSLRNLSEAIRLRILSEEPDAMWADADTIWGDCSGFDGLDKSNPLFSSPDGKRLNTGVIISLGQREFFKGLLDEYIAIKNELPNQIGIVLKRRLKEIRLIPKGFFYDINLSATNSDAISIASENYCVTKDSTGEWKFQFLRGVFPATKS